ncbi:MAG: hypothetical protein Q8761_03005, partial [Sweet potato little leaf phytoplasma]|nr:hypothetical protein [Sweet potato little leaf phytoplasma]
YFNAITIKSFGVRIIRGGKKIKSFFYPIPIPLHFPVIPSATTSTFVTTSDSKTSVSVASPKGLRHSIFPVTIKPSKPRIQSNPEAKSNPNLILIDLKPLTHLSPSLFRGLQTDPERKERR